MVEDYTLLKSQKNEVVKILQGAGLEPADFSWTGEPSISDVQARVSRLNYRGSQFYFQFDFIRNEGWDNSRDRKLSTIRCCEFSPGKDAAVMREQPEHWVVQEGCLCMWIDCLKREIEAPDLWAEMEKYKVAFSLALPEQIVNEPIPIFEAEKISEKLNLLADKIEEQFELTNEQNQFVRNKLDYLADATKRQRSLDWAYTLIGVSVTIAVGLGLAPDKAKELWELLKTIGEFIHLIGP